MIYVNIYIFAFVIKTMMIFNCAIVQDESIKSGTEMYNEFHLEKMSLQLKGSRKA